MTAELVVPVTNAGNRLVDGLDAVGLVLFLICVWQIWVGREKDKELKDMTGRFIEIAEKNNITQERLCTLIEGRGNRHG